MEEKENRVWWVFANEDLCNHTKALYELGYINWATPNKRNIIIGDTIYLFMSNTRSVRFKTVVTDEHQKRTDGSYWKPGVDIPDKDTFVLKFKAEYNEDKLDEDKLINRGFKGGGSLESPALLEGKMLNYIESTFKTLGSPDPKQEVSI